MKIIDHIYKSTVRDTTVSVDSDESLVSFNVHQCTPLRLFLTVQGQKRQGSHPSGEVRQGHWDAI